MTTRGDLVHDLAQAVRTVRASVAETGFPLPVPSAAAARAQSAALLAQIDDYLLPRLTNPYAPLLVVVGGSTGAGKSTLVNSLARAPVSAAGVLRPTTRAPVLVCHPSDAPWFRSGTLFGAAPARGANAATGMAGTTDAAARRGAARLDRHPSAARPQLISAPALPPGLAFLDAPDIDSVVTANREFAHRLLAAADMWLFMTTANRYADAVPWQLLRTARERGTVVALVLARVSLAATDEVVGLLSGMLRENRLTDVPLFVLPEIRVPRQGLLPETFTEPLRSWFDKLAGDEPARASVIRYTLDGALAALPPQLMALATAAEEQLAVAETLAEQVGLVYGVARGTVERGLRAAGAIDPVAAPSAMPSLPAPTAPVPEQAATSRPSTARHRQSAAELAAVQLVHSAAADAAEQTDTAWRSHPVGAALLGGETLAPDEDLPRQVQRIARESPPEHWSARIGELLDVEAARWLARLSGVRLDGRLGLQLREAAAELERIRLAARLADFAPAASAPAAGTPEAGPAAGQSSAPPPAPPAPPGTGPDLAGPSAGAPPPPQAGPADPASRATGAATRVTMEGRL